MTTMDKSSFARESSFIAFPLRYSFLEEDSFFRVASALVVETFLLFSVQFELIGFKAAQLAVTKKFRH